MDRRKSPPKLADDAPEVFLALSCNVVAECCLFYFSPRFATRPGDRDISS